MSEPVLYRLTEVAKLASISRSQVYVLVRRGEIPTVKVGDRMRVPKVAMERWIEEKLKARTSDSTDRG